MSTWRVNVEGKDRTVMMDSPMFGRKVIYVDGLEIKKVGMPFSMWANYKFDIDGTPAVIKFRAIKRMKGMSLYIDDERIEPQPGGEMSAEAVGMILIAVPFLIVGAIGFALLF